MKYESAGPRQILSRIWHFLKEVDEPTLAGVHHDAVSHELDKIPERRRSDRLWMYLPVLIYGRTVESEPFHEGTEVLRGNAGGGLITLTTPVRCGQRLLLINKLNQKEHECHVVANRSQYLERTAVVIGFQEPDPDFWA